MKNPFFQQLVQSVLELDRSLDRLGDLAASCGCPSPQHLEWHALLKGKLIPQLAEKPLLIVAVMGGTNTGKSLIFNQLVGDHVSAVDHRASGTKHPVCIVPADNLEDGSGDVESVLARHFEMFKLVRRTESEQPLQECEEHRLFWTVGHKIPKRLLLLDTPDIDSDRTVNWDRAKAIRDAADVLIAVLTSQKYNDAAVRRFFREAHKAGKPVMVLFNMVDFDADPVAKWLERFVMETGVKPLAVLASPFDKQRAERLEVSFHELNDDDSGERATDRSVALAQLLTELHFDAIKSQTLLGALNVLTDPSTGLQAYLDSVERSAGRFAEARETLKNAGGAAVHWPGLPTSVLVEEIRAWWNSGRPPWSQRINGVYRRVGAGLLWPIKKATTHVSRQFFGASPAMLDSLEDFRNGEMRAAVSFVEGIIQRLEKLAETDNPVLRREILDLIGGEHRAALIHRAHEVLDNLAPVSEEFRETLRRHLDEWAERNSQTVGWGRSLDNIAAVARPVVTVTLMLSGMAVGAQLVSQTVGEMAVAGGITAGGEAALHAGSESAATGISKLFQKIQEDFVLARSNQFCKMFQKELWHDVMDRLQAGAGVTDSEAFQQCRNWRIPTRLTPDS